VSSGRLSRSEYSMIRRTRPRARRAPRTAVTVLQRGGQRRQGAVHRDLPLGRVDGELRSERHGTRAVTARDEVALDLDVSQHLEEVARVRGEERFVDLLALAAEPSVPEPPRRRAVDSRGLVGGREQLASLGSRQQEERVVAELAAEPRVDLLVLEMRVGLVRPGGFALTATEADRPPLRFRASGRPS